MTNTRKTKLLSKYVLYKPGQVIPIRLHVHPAKIQSDVEADLNLRSAHL